VRTLLQQVCTSVRIVGGRPARLSRSPRWPTRVWNKGRGEGWGELVFPMGGAKVSQTRG
jgi:hypothetical protein